MMPGLINAHTHLPMTLMRGYGGGCDLHTWLNQYIFPAEARLDSRAVAAGAGLGLAEMIASGVTCVADMYMHTGTIAEQILEAGIQCPTCPAAGCTSARPEDFSPETCGDCRNQAALTEEWHGAGAGQILVDASVHGEYTSNPPLWRWMAEYAAEHRLGMHVHVSETQSEHQASLERWGKTPIQALDGCGVWDCGRSLAAHCVYTTEEDWALMAEKGISCVHNPWSNLKLGSGVAPIPAMMRAGVNVVLGTDGMSSHNSADLFSDIKLAARPAQRGGAGPHGRECLGRPGDGHRQRRPGPGQGYGVIAPGKTADLILVDLSAPNLIPCHDPVEDLVFSAHGSNVEMNMARGQVIYEKGSFLTLDLERVRWEVEHYALPLIFG